MKLEWKRVYEPPPHNHKVSHYLAESPYYHMVLRIWPKGGHITVKRFVLEVCYKNEPALAVTFYKKRDAEEWADAFFSQDGAQIKAIQLVPLYS